VIEIPSKSGSVARVVALTRLFIENLQWERATFESGKVTANGLADKLARRVTEVNCAKLR
jgi:hypothetical protein